MDSDGEIEYLDEDADIVQQCVQTTFTTTESVTLKRKVNVNDDGNQQPHLVERINSERKKRKKPQKDDDSDYDPTEDIMPPSPPVSPSPSKRRKITLRKYTNKSTSQTARPVQRHVKPVLQSTVNQFFNRKKMTIKMPDHEDPLCLPVRAVMTIGSDINRLRNWNKACIEHFKQCDNLFTPEKGETKKSARTTVLKKVVNKDSGTSETAVWTKTCVINKEGIRKSELFQSMLPKYREKKILTPFTVNPAKQYKFHHKDEVLLTKEEYKNNDVLVAYKPQESLSAVYKFEKQNMQDGEKSTESNSETRRVLREVACCKVCASCYQTSWRGSVSKTDKNKLQCPICKRITISVYNLLTHVRAHSANDVRAHRRAISLALSGVVDYHYKCRICQLKLRSIKGLREHVTKHKAPIPFRCEIGNHMTR
ncbi:unnamed protein product [Diatraea saccharalis]|uniref:C2H2-type domain-containing protein n=1 Tax=Diatraea saccharalis TaxID=40085 RepID=A0A9N9WHS6_9NEOP|nr:unnamed protein product [Diatraea saccharalis]